MRHVWRGKNNLVRKPEGGEHLKDPSYQYNIKADLSRATRERGHIQLEQDRKE